MQQTKSAADDRCLSIRLVMNTRERARQSMDRQKKQISTHKENSWQP